MSRAKATKRYSLIFTEYEDDADMDSAMVKTQHGREPAGRRPIGYGVHSGLMEINPDMMATRYVAVDYDGMDI